MDALQAITTARTLTDARARLMAQGMSAAEAAAELERAAVGLWCAEAWALLVDELLSLRRAQQREQTVAEALALTRDALPHLADDDDRYPAAEGPDPLAQRAGAVARLGDTSAKLLLAESKIRDAVERRRVALTRRHAELLIMARADRRLVLEQLAQIAASQGAMDTARVLLAHVERRAVLEDPSPIASAAARVIEDPISAAAARVDRAWVALHLARVQGDGERAAEEELDRASAAHRAALASGGTDAPEDVREAIAVLELDAARGRL